MTEIEPYCCNCHSDYPVGDHFRMGVLVPLDKAPKRLRDRFRSWMQPDSFPEGRYLCGSCYFDLTDEW